MVAKHLATIEKRLDTVVANQQLILKFLNVEGENSNQIHLGIKLPCETHEDVKNLDRWILDQNNEKELVTFSSYLINKFKIVGLPKHLPFINN